MRSAVVARAMALDEPQAVVEQLASRPPRVAKQWARDHGLTAADLGVACAGLDEKATQLPELPPTRAGEFTAAKTADWSDEQLEAAVGECLDDPQALDALARLIDARQAMNEVLAQLERSQATAAQRNLDAPDPWAEATPLTSPGLRRGSRLSADKQLRADYETWVDIQWMQAEDDCRGVLLNAQGRAAGVDARSLFSGPVARASKYASEELLSWWGRHGRLTFAAYRYQALGRDSDKAAAEKARLGRAFEDVAAW